MSKHSHWAAIGIPSQEALIDALKQALTEDAKEVRTSIGASYQASDGSVDIWAHPEAGCAMPYFATNTTINVNPIEWVSASDGCPYCATLDLEVLDDDGMVRYPLSVAFNNVGSAQDKITLDTTMELSLATFIERGESWEDVAAYQLAHPDKYPADGKATLANRALPGLNWYIPLGRFAAVESMRDENPRACFYGTVKSVERLSNTWTKATYRKAKIECAGKVYDCVVQDDVLPDLTAGNIVYVECWLCASLISEGF